MSDIIYNPEAKSNNFEDQDNIELSAIMGSIREQVRQLNDSVAEASDTILDKVEVADAQKSAGNRILQDAAHQLDELQNQSVEVKWYHRLFGKSKDAVKASIEKSRSLRGNIDRMFSALGSAADNVENSTKPFFQLRSSLQDSLNKSAVILTAINEHLASEGVDAYEQMMLESLRAEITSIQTVAQNTLTQVEMSIRSSSALLTNLKEMRPLVKGMISSQTTLSVQNAKNRELEKTMDVVGKTVNELVKTNVSETNKTAIDALRLSTRPMIARGTIEHVGQENVKFANDFKNEVIRIRNDMRGYMTALNETEALVSGNTTSLMIEAARTEEKQAETSIPAQEQTINATVVETNSVELNNGNQEA